jgi:hypothetical protein
VVEERNCLHGYESRHSCSEQKVLRR